MAKATTKKPAAKAAPAKLKADLRRKIVVVRRSEDWMAFPAGAERLYQSGRSLFEAIGKLVAAHGELFGVVVVETPRDMPGEPKEAG